MSKSSANRERRKSRRASQLRISANIGASRRCWDLARCSLRGGKRALEVIAKKR